MLEEVVTAEQMDAHAGSLASMGMPSLAYIDNFDGVDGRWKKPSDHLRRSRLGHR